MTGKWTRLIKVNAWIILHHVGVNAVPGRHYFDAVNSYHKSKGWGMIGYNWFIETCPLNSSIRIEDLKTVQDFIDVGIIKKGRPENMVGAHTFQQLMNWRSIGICLAGHLDIQEPTAWQQRALRLLLIDRQLEYGIRNGKVRFHDTFAHYKTCPGKNLKKTIHSHMLDRDMRYKLQNVVENDLV